MYRSLWLLALFSLFACECDSPTAVDNNNLNNDLNWSNLFDSGLSIDTSNTMDSGNTASIADSGTSTSSGGWPSFPSDAGTTVAAPVDSGMGDDACVAVSATANNVILPVDIIWVIDSSPSMSDSITRVENNMNLFAEDIGNSGLDYHVILVGADEDHTYDAQNFLGICIPEPLSGAAGCPDTDSDRYLHVREGVHSSDSLSELIAAYDEYKSFLREDGVVHFVVVTDDDTGFAADAEDFNGFINSATSPGFPNGFTFHSIVELNGWDATCNTEGGPPCGCGEEPGLPYINLSQSTNGVIHSICLEDWSIVFNALKQNLIQGALLPCEFEIAPLENQLQINPNETNVVLIDTLTGERTTLPNVDSPNECDDHQAWFFDSPSNPQKAILCQAACGLSNTTIELEFGCEIMKYPN